MILSSIPNGSSGPDISIAKIWIGETLRVGNVELNMDASSWHHHNYYRDAVYNSVIFHVVWSNDVEVFK